MIKLLIFTQKVDRNDPVLGFFHHWLEVFASRFEHITVICLGKGEYTLPANVKVLSLGKEEGVSKFTYLRRFFRYIWQERKNYDAVFVHMNQEYVLLGWKLWFLMGKRVYMWRNHSKGSLLTRLAGLFSRKVFYTSPNSYTAKFRNAVRMPVGIDTNLFKPDPNVSRIPYSFLFLGRIAPIKKTLEFVEWFNTLPPESVATVAGEALPKDKDYEDLCRNKASNRVSFIGAVTQNEAIKLYQTHETYVNKTPAGSMDKTIFEARAAGCNLMVDNPDAEQLFGEDQSLNRLTERLSEEIQ